jgi:hypothetical protein
VALFGQCGTLTATDLSSTDLNLSGRGGETTQLYCKESHNCDIITSVSPTLTCFHSLLQESAEIDDHRSDHRNLCGCGVLTTQHTAKYASQSQQRRRMCGNTGRPQSDGNCHFQGRCSYDPFIGLVVVDIDGCTRGDGNTDGPYQNAGPTYWPTARNDTVMSLPRGQHKQFQEARGP